MIDIHTHILPFVDDGSSALLNSLKMLKEEKKAGVDKIFLTPHHKPNKYDTPHEKIIEEFEKFKKFASDNGFDGELYLGREYYVDEDFFENFKTADIITMNGTKYVLIEFSVFISAKIQDIIYKFVQMGYVPIIAHIERYMYLDWHDLYDFKKLGALIQVNASCIAGEMVRKNRETILLAICDGLIDFVASDAHYGRKNFMKKAYNIVKKKLNRDIAEDLFTKNAEYLLLNKR